MKLDGRPLTQGIIFLFCFFVFVGTVSIHAVFADDVPTTDMTVVETPADTTAPTITALSPIMAIINKATIITVLAEDDVGIASCHLFVNDVDLGAMTYDADGNFYEILVTYTDNGTSYTYAECTDAAGNVTDTEKTHIQILSTIDRLNPVLTKLAPIAATTGDNVEFTLSYADNIGVTTCTMYYGGIELGRMALDGTVAHLFHTVDAAGTLSIYARCADAWGNALDNELVTITVTDPVTPPPSIPGAEPGDLIKTQCHAGALADNPCKAVYFYGTDFERHAFPNDKVYFTWYADFSTVKTIGADDMASLPIGKNVTYRPGARLVKFASANKVYAVGTQGELRPIYDESIAAALYGIDWNTEVDDIADTFYGNYTFGSEITNAAFYDPVYVYDLVSDVNDILVITVLRW